MKNHKTYYKRNLPHHQPAGHTFFITYRLNGSLPVEVIKKLKGDRDKQLREVAAYPDKSIRDKSRITTSQLFIPQ